MARHSDEMYYQIKDDFESGVHKYDLIAADVVWSASFATNGWVEDLSADFYDNYQTQDFIGASLNSVIYDYKVWGIPWYTDAGMLFYRKDLLEKSGFTDPPRTWGDLTTMAKKVMQESGTKQGFVFQGDDYEGGVTNAAEFIWNAGGDIMIGDLSIDPSFDEADIDPNIITVNDTKATQGLTSAYEMIKQGVVSPEVTSMREKECQDIFNNGDAVFMRNWPTSYGLLDLVSSKINSDQVGVAPIPSGTLDLPQFSCLGGWNLMISSKISLDKKDACWKFIRFLADDKQQKALVEETGALPTSRRLYEDSNLLNDVPVILLAKDILKNTRSRPVSPYYMEISPLVSSAFTDILSNKQNSYEAAEALAAQLEEVMAKYR
jgi:multiple sugar transport system substrate-binding protein